MHGLLGDDLAQEHEAVARVVRQRAREHLVEQHPHRVHVDARVGRLARDLLGGHVAQRPDQRALRGVVRDLLGLRDLRDAEIQHLHVVVVARAVDEDVLGLQVSVNHPGVVGHAQGVEGLHRDVHRALDREALLAAQDRAQGFALQELHHEEELALLVLAEIDELDDVRVGEPRDDVGLAHEAGEARGVGRVLGGEHLDGHVTADRALHRAVHGAHAARPDHVEHFKARGVERGEHRGRVISAARAGVRGGQGVVSVGGAVVGWMR